MYDAQLEKLIEISIMDGVLTEKEKQILFRKAQALGIDLDEFEMVLEARLFEKQKNEVSNIAPTISEKIGLMKKCPACGAIPKSFNVVCPECGYEFRNVETNKVILDLFQRLEDVVKECNNKQYSGGFLSRFETSGMIEEKKMTKIIERQKTIILNFPIPNNKEDLLDFLYFSQAKANANYETEPNRDAWKIKFQEVFNKAKVLLKNDKSIVDELDLMHKRTIKTGLSSFFSRRSSKKRSFKGCIIKGLIIYFIIAIISALISLLFSLV